MWGTATAAHQVEGENRNSDWWAWEQRPDSPVAEPSGTAIDHYNRYPDDVALLADLGLPVYRFSVEWARIEPVEGSFDDGALAHYRLVAETVRAAGMTPMVTLNHFTLPIWIGARGGWMHPGTPDHLASYCSRVVSELGDLVDWYCTINEPGNVALGYLGALGFPPGTTTMATWEAAIDGLCKGVVRSRQATKQARPEAKVGATHSMIEFETNDAGQPLVEFFRERMEDRFLAASSDDDFLGVQTYTRAVIAPPPWSAPLVRALTELGPVRRAVVPWLFRRVSRIGDTAGKSARTTDMGYEYRPQAIAATVRRANELLPGKPLVVTEHGIATKDDTERIEFIRDGLVALHPLLDDGVPLLGYIYWSAFDNFEWALGYRMQFGLIGVDRSTQARVVKPSARFLGEVAQANAVVID